MFCKFKSCIRDIGKCCAIKLHCCVSCYLFASCWCDGGLKVVVVSKKNLLFGVCVLVLLLLVVVVIMVVVVVLVL